MFAVRGGARQRGLQHWQGIVRQRCRRLTAHLRLQFLLLSVLTLSGLSPLVTPLAFAAEPVLRVIAWPGYADADVVKAFESRFHARVEVTIIDSDEALWDKMHSGNAPPFDVLAANTAEVQRYRRADLLAPLDLAQIPNTRHQLPRFQDRGSIGGLTFDGQVYAIPFTYSSIGLIYDRKQFDQPPTSMAVLWDPRFQGKVLDFNSAQHNFSFTALLLGYHDPFHLDDAQFHTITEKLIALRRNLLTYYTFPEEATAYFIQHHIAVMLGNYGTQQVAQLRRAGADVGYVLPEEGALAWLDCWSMTRSVSHPALAQSWINYMLEPDVSALLTQRQGLANTLTPSSDSETSRHLYWIQPVDDIHRREVLWNRIVSGDRPALFQ